MFALFQISEEKLSSIPNYRLNPRFTNWDDAAFEWLTEYELSLVYPTEEAVDFEVITPTYAPEEEESTFSALIVEYDLDEETTTLKNEQSYEDLELRLATTTETLEDDYSEEDKFDQLTTENSDEDFSSTVQTPIKTYVGETSESESDDEDQKQVPSLSGGILYKGLSFVAFTVVPFVILL